MTLFGSRHVSKMPQSILGVDCVEVAIVQSREQHAGGGGTEEPERAQKQVPFRARTMVAAGMHAVDS